MHELSVNMDIFGIDESDMFRITTSPLCMYTLPFDTPGKHHQQNNFFRENSRTNERIWYNYKYLNEYTIIP